MLLPPQVTPQMEKELSQIPGGQRCADGHPWFLASAIHSEEIAIMEEQPAQWAVEHQETTPATTPPLASSRQASDDCESALYPYHETAFWLSGVWFARGMTMLLNISTGKQERGGLRGINVSYSLHSILIRHGKAVNKMVISPFWNNDVRLLFIYSDLGFERMIVCRQRMFKSLCLRLTCCLCFQDPRRVYLFHIWVSNR